VGGSCQGDQAQVKRRFDSKALKSFGLFRTRCCETRGELLQLVGKPPVKSVGRCVCIWHPCQYPRAEMHMEVRHPSLNLTSPEVHFSFTLVQTSVGRKVLKYPLQLRRCVRLRMPDEDIETGGQQNIAAWHGCVPSPWRVAAQLRGAGPSRSPVGAIIACTRSQSTLRSRSVPMSHGRQRVNELGAALFAWQPCESS
jgi:hypothetical protein